jgi:hypothetical protein
MAVQAMCGDCHQHLDAFGILNFHKICYHVNKRTCLNLKAVRFSKVQLLYTAKESCGISGDSLALWLLKHKILRSPGPEVWYKKMFVA